MTAVVDPKEKSKLMKTDKLSDIEHIKQMIVTNNVEFVDLRFTDLRGKNIVTLPKSKIDDSFSNTAKRSMALHCAAGKTLMNLIYY